MEDAEEFDIEDQPEAEEERRKRPVIKNAMDLQRLKLEKLMKNPDKPIVIPEQSKEKDFLHSVPTFVRNVMGSSAGAGSGEFHVYRHLRRKEYARQKYIQAKSIREQLDDDYRKKLEQNKLDAEAKTAKKRAKRLKKKQKMKERGKKRKTNSESDRNVEEKSEDSESEDEKSDTNEDNSTELNQGGEEKNKEENEDKNQHFPTVSSSEAVPPVKNNNEESNEIQLEEKKQANQELTDIKINSNETKTNDESARKTELSSEIPKKTTDESSTMNTSEEIDNSNAGNKSLSEQLESEPIEGST